MARRSAAVIAVLFAGLSVADVGAVKGWGVPFNPPGTAFTARIGVERVQLVRATLADLAVFRIAAASDPYADQADLLDLIDRDVIVIFVESYGRTSMDTPFYADLHRATLADGQDRLAKSGLAMASGYLASPTKGGKAGWHIRPLPTGCGSATRSAIALHWCRGARRCFIWRKGRGSRRRR